MYREHPEYGSIAGVSIRGRKYVYFYCRDLQTGRRKATSCGPAESPQSWAKAQGLRVEYLQDRLRWLTESYSKEIARINKMMGKLAEESRIASKIRKD